MISDETWKRLDERYGLKVELKQNPLPQFEDDLENLNDVGLPFPVPYNQHIFEPVQKTVAANSEDRVPVDYHPSWVILQNLSAQDIQVSFGSSFNPNRRFIHYGTERKSYPFPGGENICFKNATSGAIDLIVIFSDQPVWG